MLLKKVILGIVIGLFILLLPKNEERDIAWLSKFDKERIEGEILLISIDNEIRGGRPVPHKRYAECVRRLKDRGFQVIGFDVIFSEDTEGDPDFAKEIKEAGVCLGLSFSDKAHPSELDSGLGLAEAGGFIEAKGVQTALSPSCLSSATIGHINLADNPIITGIPVAISYKNQVFPSIALQIAGRFIDCKFRIEKDRVVLKRGQKNLQTIHLKSGQIPIKLCRFKTCSFSDVFSNNLPRAKIALIGGEEGDLHSTTHGLIPGFRILASCISNIIHQETPLYSPFLLGAILILSFCLAPFLFNRLILQVSFLFFYLLITAIFFRYTGFILEITRPILGLLAGIFLSFIFKIKTAEGLVSQKETYILKLKKTLGYLQQKITRKRVCRESVPSRVSIGDNGKLWDTKNSIQLTSYSLKLLSWLLKEKRLHWIDGWIIFDWLRHPPGNDYKAFLVQVSKLNKEIKRFGIEVKSCGKGWYELSGLERIESSLVRVREMLDEAKRCFADKEKARAILLEVLGIDPENLEALRLLGGNTQERYNLLIKRRYD
ncbi:MAG: CHASE2 domain-containing protein, partial [Candidatus Desantisbacteria bacterium]